MSPRQLLLGHRLALGRVEDRLVHLVDLIEQQSGRVRASDGQRWTGGQRA